VATTFVLIHGGFHGSWCYEPLMPFLRQRGHRAVALDLPYHDARLGLEDFGAQTRRVVSEIGGLVAPLAASLPNVTRLVELCAIVPTPGRSVIEMHADLGADGEPTHLPAEAMPLDAEGNVTLPSKQALHDYFYQDCDEQVASWAWNRVVPMGPRVRADPSPLTRWPTCPVTVVLARDDRVVRPDYLRHAAQRLGAELLEVDGGHSPFASRPEELGELLVSGA
jgi:pimeloyl-ACP methyl ester carboxylesterase